MRALPLRRPIPLPPARVERPPSRARPHQTHRRPLPTPPPDPNQMVCRHEQNAAFMAQAMGRLTGRVRLLGGWSVRLRGQGFHVNHVHPRGWLSSAFYVSLPPEVGVDGDAGKLTFGVPDQKLGLDLAPRRIITPVAGRLALFPSYAWHGTVPFQSETPRLTAAFDALPV